MLNSSRTHRWSTLHPDRVSGSPGGRGHPVSALNLSVCHCRLWGRVTTSEQTVTDRHTSLWEHPWLTLIGQTAQIHEHKSKEWENVKRGCLRESCPQRSRWGCCWTSPLDSRTMDIPMSDSTTRITSREMAMPFQFLSPPIGPMSCTSREGRCFSVSALKDVK